MLKLGKFGQETRTNGRKAKFFTKIDTKELTNNLHITDVFFRLGVDPQEFINKYNESSDKNKSPTKSNATTSKNIRIEHDITNTDLDSEKSNDEFDENETNFNQKRTADNNVINKKPNKSFKQSSLVDSNDM